MATAPQIQNRKHQLLTHPETPQLLQTDALGQSRAKWPARLQLLHSSAGALDMITTRHSHNIRVSLWPSYQGNSIIQYQLIDLKSLLNWPAQPVNGTSVTNASRTVACCILLLPLLYYHLSLPLSSSYLVWRNSHTTMEKKGTIRKP